MLSKSLLHKASSGGLIFFSLLFSTVMWAQTLPTDSLVLVHTSKHYHTSLETISETNRLVLNFSARENHVIALSQKPIAQDPLWYSFRSEPEVSAEYISRMGEHSLVPTSNTRKTSVTFAGGYHSACLGLAVAETISRFIADPKLQELEIILPMKTIFTGFLWKDKTLIPSIEFESYADSSIDGLNLSQAVGSFDDQEWLQFISESLRWAIFIRGPIVRANLNDVSFQIERDERILQPATPKAKLVRLHYTK